MLLLSTASVVLAQDCPPNQICNPLKVDSLQALLDAIINFIFWIGMTLAPVILIIAGFLYVTSAGDPKKVETAKRMILYALIGLVILLLAKGFVVVLKSIIGVR